MSRWFESAQRCPFGSQIVLTLGIWYPLSSLMLFSLHEIFQWMLYSQFSGGLDVVVVNLIKVFHRSNLKRCGIWFISGMEIGNPLFLSRALCFRKFFKFLFFRLCDWLKNLKKFIRPNLRLFFIFWTLPYLFFKLLFDFANCWWGEKNGVFFYRCSSK